MTTIAVVGGGIAGLAAAYELVQLGQDVVLLEAGDRLGGKIRTSEFAGRRLDEGADAFLARVPWGVELCRELGLSDDLVSPAEGSALVWARGRLRPIPDGVVLGVPTGIGSLARSGLISPAGLVRAGLDLVLPRSGDGSRDRSVGELIRSRMGGEVLELLVDPLLGGINAGDADRLSTEASAPQLADAARRHRSLILGLRSAPKAAPGPVFYAHPAGMERLVDALAERLTGVDVRLRAAVEELVPPSDATGRYRLEPLGVEADGVIIATPAFTAAALLAHAAPEVAAGLRAIEYSSVSLVSMAFPRTAVPGPLDASGYLVPKREGRLTTAVSWSSSKWEHLARADDVVVRISAGRYGDQRAMDLDDDALVDVLAGELRQATKITGAPSAVRVSRWPLAFPQYTPGHLDRVQEIERRVANALRGVQLAGAAYRGVGIPACIRQGREAARAVSTDGGPAKR